MDFRLDEGQIELQQTVDRFFADRFPLDRLAEREGAPVDRATWAEMAQLGIFGLLLPVESGGSGLGAVEAAIVFEMIGRHLVPGPARWAMLASGLVDGAATGEALVAGLLAAQVTEAAVVEHAGELDVVLVIGAEGIVSHRRDSLGVPEPLAPLDPLTPVGRFAALPEGTLIGGAGAAGRLLTLGRVVAAAEATGVAARALEVARSYALEREQFGVPIGSFQAIKHLLADMYLRVELAQSATYAAAAMLDQSGNHEAHRAAAAAKLLACDAATSVSSDAVQVLGGMGFTWDMLPNYLVKRAWVLEQSFGTMDELAEMVGDLVGGGAA